MGRLAGNLLARIDGVSPHWTMGYPPDPRKVLCREIWEWGRTKNMIHCTYCLRGKPPTDFHRDRNRATGRHAWCKACRRLYDITDHSHDSHRGWSNKHRTSQRLTPHATRSPSTVDLAWAAGFLEGEGSFQCAPYIRLEAAQAIQEPLDRLQAIFGGSISEYRHPRSPNVPMFMWRTHGSRAEGIMMTLFLFLSARRRDQVRRAIAMRRAKHPPPTAQRPTTAQGIQAWLQAKNGAPKPTVPGGAP